MPGSVSIRGPLQVYTTMPGTVSLRGPVQVYISQCQYQCLSEDQFQLYTTMPVSVSVRGPVQVNTAIPVTVSIIGPVPAYTTIQYHCRCPSEDQCQHIPQYQCQCLPDNQCKYKVYYNVPEISVSARGKVHSKTNIFFPLAHSQCYKYLADLLEKSLPHFLHRRRPRPHKAAGNGSSTAL